MSNTPDLQQAIALHQQGRLYEAEQIYTQLLAQNPTNADAQHLLGVVAHQNGNYPKAIADINQAILLKNNDWQYYNNLGCAHLAANHTEDAQRAFEKALNLNPGAVDALSNTGDILRAQGRFDEALDYYKKALVQNPHFAPAYFGSGCVFFDNKEDVDSAMQALAASITFDPYNETYLNKLREVTETRAMIWHFPMMNDEARNKAYLKAIEQTVTPGNHVLEIGTGSGLLSMMAARAGAGRVTTVEIMKNVYDAATEIIKNNGYADKITVLNKPSTAMILGPDIDEKADMLICEIFDAGLIQEDALFSIMHAKQALLKEGATIVPRRGRLYGVPVDSEDLHLFGGVGTVEGFDLSVFNKLANRRLMVINNKQMDYEQVAEPELVFDFDFMGHFDLGGEAFIPLTITKEGHIDACMFWFELDLTDEVTISTKPEINETRNWSQFIQLVPEHVPVKPGQDYHMHARYLRQHIFIDIKPGKVPQQPASFAEAQAAAQATIGQKR